MPRVSAIIIVRDGEEFIADAIDSVVGQSFADWELLVVDDGSTDRTRQCVEPYVRGDARIRLVRHPDGANHGMSASRNLGLDLASGEFVAFLDADDIWLPDKLAEQVAILVRQAEAAMVYGRTLIWHAWSASPDGHDHCYSLGVAPDALYRPPLLFRQLLRNQHQTPTTCNAMMRRSALDAVGRFDPAFRGMFEDQLVFAKLLQRFAAFVSGTLWAKYRQHPASASSQSGRPAGARAVHFRYLRALRRYLVAGGKARSSDRIAVELAIARLRFAAGKRALRRRARKLLGR